MTEQIKAELTEEEQHTLAGTIFYAAIQQVEEDFNKRWDNQAPFIALGRGCHHGMEAHATKFYDSSPVYARYRNDPEFRRWEYYSQETRNEEAQRLHHEAEELVKMGLDFKIILGAIEKDDFVKSAWDSFMVALKMVED